jgi:sugar/nucleoside kinase (ribokinase family)
MPTANSRRPTVLVVGAATRDVEPADPRGWRLGGTVSYASLAIARLGLPVRTLIGVDEEASSAHELGLLLAAGCEIELARLGRGPVFDNQQAAHGRRQVALSPSDPIRLADLPRAWRQADAVLLGPIAGELGPAWAAAFPTGTPMALAWQGLLRRLSAGRPVEALPVRPHALIARADLAAASVEDVAGTADGTPLTFLLPRPGQELLLTHGPRSSLHIERSARGLHGRLLPSVPARHVADTTGAGDVLLGAWLAGLVAARAAGRPARSAQLLRFATAAATASLEGVGLSAVPELRALCERLMRRPA